MAIYKDGKKWVLSKDGKDLFEEFKSEFSHLLNDSKEFVGQLHMKYARHLFRTTQGAFERELNGGSTSSKYVFPRKGIRLEFTTFDQSGAPTKWQYCSKTPAYDKATGEYLIKNGDVDVVVLGDETGNRDGISFKLPKDIERAWLIWKYSPAVLNRPNSNRIYGRCFAYFENKVKEADAFKRNRKAVHIAEGKIWDMNRAQLENLYRTIMSSEVPYSNGKPWTDAQVQRSIIDVLGDPVMQETIINLLEVGTGEIDVAQVVQTAIENGIIQFDKGEAFFKNGVAKIKLAPVDSDTENYGGIIADFLKANPDKLSKIQKQIEKTEA